MISESKQKKIEKRQKKKCDKLALKSLKCRCNILKYYTKCIKKNILEKSKNGEFSYSLNIENSYIEEVEEIFKSHGFITKIHYIYDIIYLKISWDTLEKNLDNERKEEEK